MAAMNKRMNLPALQKIMMEFERQNERMEMTQEVMGDAIDDAFEGEGEEEESEELVSQVLDEIGINLDTQLVTAPGQAIAAPAVAAPPQAEAVGAGGGDGIDDDLQARLNNLRKS